MIDIEKPKTLEELLKEISNDLREMEIEIKSLESKYQKIYLYKMQLEEILKESRK